MDLDHALRVFRLYRYHADRNPLDAEKMLLTEGERQAIAEIEKLLSECSDAYRGRTRAVVTKAA